MSQDDNSVPLTILGDARAGGEKKHGSSPDSVAYEDAIALVGSGKFHFGLLMVCGGCITATICELLGVGYLLPAAQCDLEMTDSNKGILGAIAFVGMLFGSHLWGFLADTTGRRSVIRLTLIIDVILAVVASIVPSFWMFLVLRFLSGFFVTAPQAVGYAYLGEFHNPDSRAKAFVWAAVFPAIGLIFLPGIGWWILPMDWALELPWVRVHSWRLYVILCAVPSLLTAVGVSLLPESPKHLLSQGRAEEALAVLRKVYHVNTGRPGEDFPVASLKTTSDDGTERAGGAGGAGVNPKSVTAIMRSVWNQTAPLFTLEYAWSTFLALFIMFGIIAGANGLPTWLPELFNRMARFESEHDGETASICESVEGLAKNATSSGSGGECKAVVETDVFVNNLYVGAAGVIAPVLSVFLVGPMGKRNLLIVSLLLTGACGLGLEFVDSSLGFLVLSCIVCAVTEMCISLFSSISVDMFPTHLRAMAVSLSLMCGRLGSIVGNIMFGDLLESACSATFFALGGVLIACGLLSFALPRQGKYA